MRERSYFHNLFINSPEDESKLLTSLAHSRSVDHWHQLLGVLGQEPVEEPLVALQQVHQVDVLVEGVLVPPHIPQTVRHLLRLSLDPGRQETMNTKQLSFLDTSCHTLGQPEKMSR